MSGLLRSSPPSRARLAHRLPLALRLLLREWRAGEVRILLFAVALAVASLSAVAFFADRVEEALAREANTLLAADLVLQSDQPIDPAFAAEAHRRGLASVETASFLSMAQAGERHVLAGIKATTPGYPLRGSLRVAPARFAADAPASGLPPPGQVWVDERLASSLGIAVGEVLRLGEAAFRVAAILTFEGERGGNFMALAPRLLLNMADLPATGLVQEGSRITHRLLLAGEAPALAGYRAWLAPRLQRGQKLEDVREARPELREVLDRAQRYLGLAAMLSVLLAAAAAHMALRRYTQRHFDQFALLRCFGGSRRRLLGLYLRQLGGLGLLAGLLGGLLGWLTQALVGRILADVLRLELPSPTLSPLFLALSTGLALLLAFSLPPLLRLARVPALRVLRRDLGPPGGGSVLAQLLALAVVAGLLFVQAGEARLGLLVLGGILATVLAAGLLAQLVLYPLPALARRLPPAGGTFVAGLRLAAGGLRRRGWELTLQAVALSLGLFALLLLTLVRGDLLDAWRNRAAADAPNRFLINIQPEQADAVREYLRARGVAGVSLYPMVRARLTAIAGRPVRPADYPDERARRLAEREFNLSDQATLAADNRLVAGHWWRPGEREVFSVEEGLAKTLGIRLGDQLEFDAGGLPLRGRVTSLRKVDWDSFRVNFFVLAPPGSLDALPRSHVTSFHLPEARVAVLTGLLAAFPNLTLIDVARVIQEMRALMDRVSTAVEFIFLFSLGTGVLVMLAALYARRDERAREIGIWRTLGASRATLRVALTAEFVLLGLLAGGIAAAGASLSAWLLATRVFELEPAIDARIWLAGLGGGIGLVVASGLAATRPLLRQPPLAALRAGG